MDDDFRLKPILPRISVPDIPRMPLLAEERLNPAGWAFERLTKQIVDFEKDLSPGEEIGGRFVNAPKEGVIHIQDISFWNPDMLIFNGVDADGRKVRLLQHCSQLSVLLCAVPVAKDEEARRIGFILEQKIKT